MRSDPYAGWESNNGRRPPSDGVAPVDAKCREAVSRMGCVLFGVSLALALFALSQLLGDYFLRQRLARLESVVPIESAR